MSDRRPGQKARADFCGATAAEQPAQGRRLRKGESPIKNRLAGDDVLIGRFDSDMQKILLHLVFGAIIGIETLHHNFYFVYYCIILWYFHDIYYRPARAGAQYPDFVGPV